MAIMANPKVNIQLLPANIVDAFGDRFDLLVGQKENSATITAATIAFVDSDPDTITDSGSGFITAGFKAGRPITVAGSASNDGTYTIASVAAGTITLVAGDSLTVEPLGASVTITTSDSTSTDGDLYQNVQAMTPTQIEGLFGTRSELTNRIFQHRAGSDGVSRLDVIPKDDAGAAVAATGSIAFSGTATADRSFQIVVVDKFQYTITIDVLTGDSATDVGDAVVTALLALSNAPVIPSNSTGTVTFTATNAGTCGNFYGIEIIGDLPAGITAVLTGFSGGATDPTLTSIFDVVGEQRYQGIGWPEHWLDEKNIIETFLEDRFTVVNDIQRGVGFIGKSDTFANYLAFVNGLNSRVLAFSGNDLIATANADGPANMQPADYGQSYFMGLRSKRLTTGALIGDDVIATTGRLDAIGGPHTASKPYFNSEMKRMAVVPESRLFTETEQQELEEAGATVIGVNRTQTAMIMGPVVLPYKTDPAGNTNITFHYLNYWDTGDVCTEILDNSARARFVQTRLTEGDVVSGYSMENAETIKAHFLDVYRTLANIALVQAGSEAEQFVSENITITIDLSTGMVNFDGPLPIVTQLRRIDYILQYAFTLDSGQQITFK